MTVAASAAARTSLVGRVPDLGPAELVTRLEPRARFGDVGFETYEPDPSHPSQQAALEAVEAFAATIEGGGLRRPRLRRRRSAQTTSCQGLYLDGGFGVGKTHLLASLWRSAPAPSAFVSFAELTALIGAFGMETAVEVFGGHRLICIDEFELDDVAHTLMTVTLLRRLLPGGARIACTSNTLPERLGDGRFAAGDFRREIAAIASHFDVVTVDGPDYRHRSFAPVEPASDTDLCRQIELEVGASSVDEFDALLAHLRRVPTVQYGALFDGLDAVYVHGLRTIENQGDALLWVRFVDEAYGAGIAFRASGAPIEEVFAQSYRHGGYRKKYGRAESRLSAMLAEIP